MQYYVVKNKEPSMYFRGKGANMWGKYYNQASIYRFRKHAENAVEERAYRGEQAEVVEIQITEGAVTDTNVGCKWIPCSERLPEMSGSYLCCWKADDNPRITMSLLNFDGEGFPWERVNYYRNTRVWAWMPLPEPYREDGV